MRAKRFCGMCFMIWLSAATAGVGAERDLRVIGAVRQHDLMAVRALVKQGRAPTGARRRSPNSRRPAQIRTSFPRATEHR